MSVGELTLKQSSAVHIQVLVSADGILLGIRSKLWLLVINLALVPGGQLVNSPTDTKPRPLCVIIKPVPTSNATFKPLKMFKIAYENNLQTNRFKRENYY